MAQELTQEIVEVWIRNASKIFHKKDIREDLDIGSAKGKEYLRKILDRCVDKQLISRENKDGWYRRIENEMPEMDWANADPDAMLPIKLPFDIHDHVRIYPKSIIVLAAGKNQGKTAFAYNTVAMNMEQFEIDLFNTETGKEQMKPRMEILGIPKPPPFKTWERYEDFAEVIKPDRFSIIDYLDFNSEVYLVGDEIDRIFRKLTTGVCLICLQKPPPARVMKKGGDFKTVDRDLAYGGGFTAKRAALYISMGKNKLKLVYVKTPAKRNVNPNNMAWTFNLPMDEEHRGTIFTDIKRFYGEGDIQEEKDDPFWSD